MKYLLFIVIICLGLESKASHIAAGEMYYDYIGNDNYNINLLLYRDCAGLNFDSYMELTVYDQYNSVVEIAEAQLAIAAIEWVDYTTITTPTCLSQFTGACLEYFTYSLTLNLPPINGGYTITYQRCCLSPQITNIMFPDSVGFTFTSHIPGVDTGQHYNSSPRFQGHSLFLSCVNEQVDFNHSAIDPDGDSLVYSVITPFGYDWSTNLYTSNPSPDLPPPYLEVQYEMGFSPQTPLGTGGILSIDSSSGMLTVEPVLIGQFVIGVKVDEYKSGQLVNSTYRNLLMQTGLSNVGLGTIETNSSPIDISISPNPVSDLVKINSDVGHTLKVFTSDGKEILKRGWNEKGQYSIDMSTFDSGVYYFQFNTEHGNIAKPVFK